MRQPPSAWVLWVLAYVAGIVVGWQFSLRHAVWLLWGMVLIGVVLVRKRLWGRGLLLASVVFVLGGSAQALQRWQWERTQTALFASSGNKPSPLTIPHSETIAKFWYKGRIVQGPMGQAEGVAFRIQVHAKYGGDWLHPTELIQHFSIQPVVGLHLRELLQESFGVGDTLWFYATLHPPESPHNPGEWDAKTWALREGVHALAGVDFSQVRREPNDSVSSWHRPLGCVQRYLWDWRSKRLALVALALTPKEKADASRYAVVSALVLGDRTALLQVDTSREAQGKPSLSTLFRDAGIYHVLSVSGFHLTIVASLCFWGLAFLLVRLPHWPSHWSAKRVAVLGGLLGIFWYTVVTGAEVATVRAAYMAVFVLMAFWFYRRARLAEAIACAAWGLLHPGASPLLVTDPAFQLSVGAVLGLAYLRPLGEIAEILQNRWKCVRLEGFGKQHPRCFWLLQKIFRALDASSAALLVTLPICAWHFFQAQPAGLLGNAIVLPWAELLLLPVGLLGVVLLGVWAPLGLWLVQGAGWVAGLVLWLTEKVAWLPLSWVVPKPALWMLLVWMVGLLGVFFRIRRSAWLLVIALGCYLLAWAWPQPNLVVTFLDVGQGDAAVVELPGHRVMVIDGGGIPGTSHQPGERVVVPFLQSRGYHHIDVVVASHPHPDHVEGLIAVLSHFSIGEIWTAESLSAESATTQKTWQRFLELVEQKHIPIRVPSIREMDGVRIRALGPCRERETTSDTVCVIQAQERWTPNNNSLVLQFYYQGVRLLFPGDVEAPAERALLAQAGEHLQADILKVPHHCSRTSSTLAWVRQVAPKWAVCSVGRNNQYGFPHPEVVDRYQQQGTRVVRTDKQGAIRVSVTTNGKIIVESND